MTGPLSRYRQMIESGALQPDADQAAAIVRLQRLHDELRTRPLDHSTQSSGGFFASLFGKEPSSDRTNIRGVYLQGSVGRGKSMLMDLFVASSPEKSTRRVHFHAFMLEVQRRLHELRNDGQDQPIQALAHLIATETRLLCFDEFHVVDIGDAMILDRLFTGLFDQGVTVVATSNWLPERLYWEGLNRERFLPFIELLQSRIDVVTLDGPVDYRVERLRDLATWFSPLNDAAVDSVERLFLALADGAPGTAVEVAVGSRTLKVNRAHGPIALFDFPELCARPLGAADYLAIGEHFRVVFLTNVPLLAPAKRNEARRFMTLVDVLYECKRILVVTAAGQPDELYPRGEGAFEFLRTVSRLMEMQSKEWLDLAGTVAGDLPFRDFAPFALTSDLT